MLLPVLTLRPLGLFWAALAVAGVVGAIALQALGPPAPAPGPNPAPVAADAPVPGPAAARTDARPGRTTDARPGRTTQGPIPPPDPALLETAADSPGGMLPRIAADGRAPMSVYAHGFPASVASPRIGLVVAGIGLNAADSEDATRALPGAITLAVSPYASNPAKLLDLARTTEHELLVSVPMEPRDYPRNDPGPEALLTGATSAQNQRRLDWALARISGYVGATGALGTLRGERFAASSGQMGPVLETIGARGLLYVDPRPGAAPPAGIWGRTVDVVIDEPATGPEIDAKLAELEQIARERGSALGLAGAVRPVTMDRVASWAAGLAARGLVLAPVSALAQPPRADKEAER